MGRVFGAARRCSIGCAAVLLSACGGGSQNTVTSTVTVSASTSSIAAPAAPTNSASATASAESDGDVNRVISSRGDVVCLMFQTMGMNQDTLDKAAEYVMTTPAIKLSKIQGQQVIRGSVETYCPEFSEPIAEVFG